MSNSKPISFVVTSDGAKSGANGNKPWRRQEVLCHHGDEVRKIAYFLRDGEAYLEPGSYTLAPDAVYVGDIAYTGRDGKARTETGLRVAVGERVGTVERGAPDAAVRPVSLAHWLLGLA